MGTDDVMRMAVELAQAQLSSFKVVSNNKQSERAKIGAKKNSHKSHAQQDKNSKEALAR